MKVIQTFWTAGKNPLNHAFGWIHPELNLMSWALSCLCLKEYYDDVELYTDEIGKKWLIDILGLPYSKVYTVYDNRLCLTNHWAYAKIKTYSLQKEAFLHIDGDVYITQKFTKNVVNATIVAQNREYGTDFYERMLKKFLTHPGITVPKWLEEQWQNSPIASINMGVFGGNDLSIIHQCCNEVDDLITINQINNISDHRSTVNANVIFEQMLFAALASRENINIETVLNEEFADTGYTSNIFCNFEKWNQMKLLHIVGGNKRQAFICHSIEQKLHLTYPTYFRRIAELFPERHPYIGTSVEEDLITPPTITDIEELWASVDCLHTHQTFICNPLARILPYKDETGRNLIYIPMIYSSIGNKVSVSPLGCNIFQLIEHKNLTYHKICEKMYPFFTAKTRTNAQTYITEELKYLLHYGVVKINSLIP